MKQLLLVKMSSLGDVVHAFPAVTEAVAAGWQVDWVVEEAFADVARAHPDVRTVIPIAWRRWRRALRQHAPEMRTFATALRANEYDLVLDSQGLIKSALVALCVRGKRAGFSHTSAREPWAAFTYAQRHPVAQQQHAIVRQRQLFAAALGYEPSLEMPQPTHNCTPSSANQVLLFHGTTWESKHWPEPMWQALLGHIIAAGYEPLVTWGDEVERLRAERLRALGATLIERQPLAKLIDLMQRVSAVISVDSGLGHLAAAMGLPTVGIYGPTDGNLTGVHGVRAKFLQGEAKCVPCLKKQCHYRGEPMDWQGEIVQPACFASVTPEKVWRTALQQMADQ